MAVFRVSFPVDGMSCVARNYGWGCVDMGQRVHVSERYQWPGDLDCSRDWDGHASHTLSLAAARGHLWPTIGICWFRVLGISARAWMAHLLNRPTTERRVLWIILWSGERALMKSFNQSGVVFRPTVYFYRLCFGPQTRSFVCWENPKHASGAAAVMSTS